MSGNSIAYHRKRRGLSQTDLAEKIGTTLNMLGKLERGARTLDTNWLTKIGSALDVPARDLLSGPEDAEVERHPTVPVEADDGIPMVGIRHADAAFGLGAAFADEPTEVQVLQFPKVWVESITYSPAELLSWVRARGRSMEPTINDGDLILLDHSERKVRDQDDIWAFTVGDTRAIKRLRVKGDRFVILSDNPSVPPDEEPIDFVNIVARVVFVGKRT